METKRYKNYELFKNKIRDAFSSLIYEKRDITKISIKELVMRANISKSTFYSHYKNIYSIADEIEEELLVGFGTINRNGNLMDQIVMIYKRHEKLLKLLYSTKHNEKFTFRLRDLLVEETINTSDFLIDEEKDKRQFKVTMTVNCILFSLIDYLQGNTSLKNYADIEKILREYIDRIK